MPAGRPSKFNKGYCEQLVSAGQEGLSLTAFAGMIGVCRDTLHEWGRQYPEFSDAIKHHQAARTLVLERALLRAESGPQVTSRIFALKNAAPQEWSDSQRVEHTGKDGGPIKTENVSDSDRARALAAFLQRTKADSGGN